MKCEICENEIPKGRRSKFCSNDCGYKKTGIIHKGKDFASKEARQRAGAARRGVKLPPEFGRKISEAKKGKKFSEEHKRALSEARKSMIAASDYGERHSERMKASWANSDNRDKYLKALHNEEITAKRSSAMKAHWANSDKRANWRSILSKAQTQAWMKGSYLERKSGLGISGHHDSPKVGRIFYRSTWEQTAYEILDKDDMVVNYKSEPFPIPYVFEEQDRNYYPDIFIEYSDGKILLVEVKPSFRLLDEQVQAKIVAAETYCETMGIDFDVWTEFNWPDMNHLPSLPSNPKNDDEFILSQKSKLDNLSERLSKFSHLAKHS
jgi:hypothetical protein